MLKDFRVSLISISGIWIRTIHQMRIRLITHLKPYCYYSSLNIVHKFEGLNGGKALKLQRCKQSWREEKDERKPTKFCFIYYQSSKFKWNEQNLPVAYFIPNLNNWYHVAYLNEDNRSFWIFLYIFARIVMYDFADVNDFPTTFVISSIIIALPVVPVLILCQFKKMEKKKQAVLTVSHFPAIENNDSEFIDKKVIKFRIFQIFFYQKVLKISLRFFWMSKLLPIIWQEMNG